MFQSAALIAGCDRPNTKFPNAYYIYFSCSPLDKGDWGVKNIASKKEIAITVSIGDNLSAGGHNLVFFTNDIQPLFNYLQPLVMVS